MNRTAFLAVIALLWTGCHREGGAPSSASEPTRLTRTKAQREAFQAAERMGWRLGVQAYSFNHFTFYEAIDKTAALGLRYIEAYPGQTLTKDKPGVQFDHNLPADLRAEIRERLRAAGLKLTNYGVVGLSTNEKDARKVFDFAEEMGIETLGSEPSLEAMDLVENLCEEYEINLAIHNHPAPSPYWSPDAVLEACKGRSKRIGSCADTGHWMRSGVDPLEALRKLKGRIVSLHFKDLNEFGVPGAHDVPWGQGAGNAREMLAELREQGFRGVFFVEYEHNWENSVPEIAECVAFFNQVAADLEKEE